MQQVATGLTAANLSEKHWPPASVSLGHSWWHCGNVTSSAETFINKTAIKKKENSRNRSRQSHSPKPHHLKLSNCCFQGETYQSLLLEDMALCSLNIQKSSLLLFWKMLNNSKAFCFLRHSVSLCVCVCSFFIFLWFPQCRNRSDWVSLILNSSCWLKKSHYISVHKRIPSVGNTGRKVSSSVFLSLFMHIRAGLHFFLCVCRCVHTCHTVSCKHRASTALLGPWATPPMRKSMLVVCRRDEEQRAVGMGATYSQHRFTGL